MYVKQKKFSNCLTIQTSNTNLTTQAIGYLLALDITTNITLSLNSPANNSNSYYFQLPGWPTSLIFTIFNCQETGRNILSWIIVQWWASGL